MAAVFVGKPIFFVGVSMRVNTFFIYYIDILCDFVDTYYLYIHSEYIYIYYTIYIYTYVYHIHRIIHLQPIFPPGARLPESSPRDLAFALASRLEEAARGQESEVFTCEAGLHGYGNWIQNGNGEKFYGNVWKKYMETMETSY